MSDLLRTDYFPLPLAVPVPGTWVSMCGQYALFPKILDTFKYSYVAKHILPDKESFVEFGISRVLLKGKAGTL